MNPLELRDIHLPDSALWWPPAPGWWLLALLLLVGALLLPWLFRRLRHKPVRRLSLQELQGIRQKLAAQEDRDIAVREVAALLRRTVIAYHGRRGYAASTGDQWLQQLQELATGQRFSEEQLALLGHNRYRRDFDCDVEGLLQACERWIRALPRSETHVSA
jgi:hypothetical protein